MHAGLVFAVVGTATHASYFNRGEHHMYGIRYLQVLLGIIVATSSSFHWVGQPWAQALVTTMTFIGYYLSGLYSSLLLYRLIISPLNRFPGPWWSGISSLALSTQLRKLDCHTRLLALHQKYGDFVRVGSSDLSIIHPKAVNVIYGRGSKCMKSDWYDLTAPMISMQTTRKRSEHDQRRRIWGAAFNDTVLRVFENRITRFQDQLVERILGLEGRSVDISELLSFYNFDVMGDLAFSTPFNLLREDRLHWVVKMLHRSVEPLGWMFPSWCFRTLLVIPGATGDWFAFMNYCCQRLEERMKTKVQAPDIMSYLLDPWKDRKLSEYDMKMLQGDCQLIVVAGSDTTASTLTYIFYELAKQPELVPKLRDEVQSLLSAGKDLSNMNLQSLPLLNGIINETLRLHPPAGVLQRKTPPEGIMIGETFVPGNMTVFSPFFAAARSEKIYADAESFLPERWYSKPETIKEPSAYAPFSAGTYNCIGKPLALLNLRTTLAKLILAFEISFSDPDDASTFMEKTRTNFISDPGSLYMRFSRVQELK